MIIREHYLKKIRNFYDSDLIKIIVGVRRCGKSIVLEQIMDEVRKKTDNIIYLNFEDEKVIANIYNGEKLLDYVDNNRQKGKCYVFLDEVHEVKDWNLAVKTLRLHDNSVFITGSNSKILAKEYTSARSIEGYLKNEHITGSINTIIKYLGYLEEACVINKISPYSLKTKNELTYYFIIYDEDVSFNSLRCLSNRFDLTHNLENIIYNELIYMDYDLKVLNKLEDDKKIDFIAMKDGKEYYIQVAYSVENEATYEREFGAFANIDNTHKKIIITNDDIDYSTSTVSHVKLKDFLLLNSLEEIR